MRTEGTRLPRTIAVAAVIAIGLVVAVLGIGWPRHNGSRAASAAELALPASSARLEADLGIELSTPSDTRVTRDIADDAARKVAETRYPDLLDDARVDQYLVRVGGNPGSVSSGRYWLVELSEFAIECGEPPMTADGTPAEAPRCTHGYLFVDAATGDLTVAHWTS